MWFISNDCCLQRSQNAIWCTGHDFNSLSRKMRKNKNSNFIIIYHSMDISLILVYSFLKIIVVVNTKNTAECPREHTQPQSAASDRLIHLYYCSNSLLTLAMWMHRHCVFPSSFHVSLLISSFLKHKLHMGKSGQHIYQKDRLYLSVQMKSAIPSDRKIQSRVDLLRDHSQVVSMKQTRRFFCAAAINVTVMQGMWNVSIIFLIGFSWALWMIGRLWIWASERLVYCLWIEPGGVWKMTQLCCFVFSQRWLCSDKITSSPAPFLTYTDADRNKVLDDSGQLSEDFNWARTHSHSLTQHHLLITPEGMTLTHNHCLEIYLSPLRIYWFTLWGLAFHSIHNIYLHTHRHAHAHTHKSLLLLYELVNNPLDCFRWASALLCSVSSNMITST